MKRTDLIAILDEISKVSDKEWMNSLDERKRIELEFHDRDRDKSKIKTLDQDTFEKYYGNKKFYRTVERSTTYVDNWIATNAKDKVFLDYACGNGSNALKAARAGAKLSIGLDISSISVSNATEAAAAEGLTNAYFLQADAENTRLPDSCVDSVICSGMLHHLDLSYAFPELRRILVSGGKLLGVEALDYNPLIKLYRTVTPDMRTEWEKAHILSLKDIKFAERFFNINEVKYWHAVSYAGAYFSSLLPLFNIIDDLITKIPLVQLMAWIFTFELEVEKKSSSASV